MVSLSSVAPTRGRAGRVRRGRGQGSRVAAFSLIELMIVVLIIAISATAAGPAFHSASIERKNQMAALDLVRLVGNARAESAAYGRAVLMRFTNSTQGSFKLYRGITNSCTNQVSAITASGWISIIAAGTCEVVDGHVAPTCFDYLDLANGDYVVSGTTISATAVRSKTDSTEAFTNIDVCFDPQGRTLWRTGANAAALNVAAFTDQDSTALGGGFLFKFNRQDDGVNTGVPRYVALPLGGDARMLR